MIQRAKTGSGSSCVSERDVITAAILMLYFKLQQESEFARINEIAIEEGLLWLQFWQTAQKSNTKKLILFQSETLSEATDSGFGRYL